jgi:pimeloyl-ACP methyl ester carboxylesterase
MRALAYSTSSQRVRLSFGNLAYRLAGSGPPLVLVHGIAATNFCWRRNLPVLGRYFTCYAIDLPGLGDSDPPEAASFFDAGETLCEFIDRLSLPPVTLIGSSWGGAITMAAAARHDAPVASLILVAPVHPFFQPNLFQRFLLTEIGPRLVCGIGSRLRWLHRPFFARMYGAPGRITPETVPGYVQPLCRPGVGRAVARYLQNWREGLKRLEGVLPQISQPVALIWGARDEVVPARTAEKLCAALKRARVQIIDTAGHLPFEETPDDFHRAVLDFLLHSESVSMRDGCRSDGQ